MRNLGYKRRLRKLQNEREKVNRANTQKLLGVTGDERQRLMAECSHAYFEIDEQVAECLSNHIVVLAERHDVALPKLQEGDYWERLHHVGDHLILSTLGREVTREKLVKEQKLRRETWAFILSFVATVGSLTVAVLTICLRK